MPCGLLNIIAVHCGCEIKKITYKNECNKQNGWE